MSPVTENNNIHGLSLYEADCSMNDKILNGREKKQVGVILDTLTVQ